jgi:putative ABC transport system substrate-binding protein
MDRRGFLLTSLAGALAVPLAAGAQQGAKVYRIGVMSVSSAANVYLDAFRQGLRELGWMEGKNIELEIRAAEGKYERLPAIAAELVRLRVDIIFAPNTPTVVAAKNATASIPIVMAAVDDPVGRGFVSTLSRPGGNITGLTMQEQDIFAKQLQFLKEVVPRVSRVSVLQTSVGMAKGLEEAAKLLRIQLQVLTARSREEFDEAFSSMVLRRADALLVVPTPCSYFTGLGLSNWRRRLVCRRCTVRRNMPRPVASWPMGRTICTTTGTPLSTLTRS